MTLDALLWAVVAVLALIAGWLSLPRPPVLDWERFFKTALVTLIRGPLEAADATAAEWLAASRARVWYHPATRHLVAKLTAPEAFEVPVPALPGERALVEDLARLEGLDQRLARTFTDEPRADEVLFDDPAELGEAYDPVPVLGPEADWEGLRRRLAHTRWVVVEAPRLAEVLAAVLGPDRVVQAEAVDAEGLGEAAPAWLPETADRVVWLAAGAGAERVARALHASPGLRDRTRAVVAVAGRLGGEARAWLDAHFDHAAFDTELSRTTPWFHLGFVDAGHGELGEPGLALRDTAWPRPADPDNGRFALETVDLGVLPGRWADTEPELLGRALLLTLVQRLALSG